MFVNLKLRCFSVLVRIQGKIQSVQGESRLKSAWHFLKDPEKIVDMKNELNEALNLFHVRLILTAFSKCSLSLAQLSSAVTTGFDVSKLLESLNIEQLLERANKKIGEGYFHAILNCKYSATPIYPQYPP